MLKKDMKKLFENFYILSKLTLSLTLLFCLFGVLYVFYLNYQKEDKISKENKIINNELKEIINKNINLIDDISKEIKDNKIALLKIEENIKSINNKNNFKNIKSIEENLKDLSKNFNSLSNQFENIKKNSFSENLNKKDPGTSKKNVDELIDLIIIKYENNLSFDKEIEYLKKILPKNKSNNFEKISLLTSQPYKGHFYLEKTYDQEVNLYLKKLIYTDKHSIFSKVILPYLDISPSSENIVNDDLILKIKKIKTNIQNRNFEIAFQNLKKINDYENVFRNSSLELSKYINFKEELIKLRWYINW